MTISRDMVARELLDVVPPIMRTIRKKWKEGSIKGVTQSQFRILMYIQNNSGTSLQEVAAHLGLTSPTTSTAVEDLVSNQLVLRQPSSEDRRKVTLSLTGKGQRILGEVFDYSGQHLADFLSPLTEAERITVYQGLKLLGPLF